MHSYEKEKGLTATGTSTQLEDWSALATSTIPQLDHAITASSGRKLLSVGFQTSDAILVSLAGNHRRKAETATVCSMEGTEGVIGRDGREGSRWSGWR